MGQENFEWVVDAVAEMAVKKALGGRESGEGVALGGAFEWAEVGGVAERQRSGRRQRRMWWRGFAPPWTRAKPRPHTSISLVY